MAYTYSVHCNGTALYLVSCKFVQLLHCYQSVLYPFCVIEQQSVGVQSDDPAAVE